MDPEHSTERRGSDAGLELLERLVRDNRTTIAVVFPVVGAALLVAGRSGVLPTALTTNPVLLVLANVVMVLPLVAGLAPLLDARASAGLVALAGFAYAVELLGVTTGVPYGDFSYGLHLGPMLFGAVPVALPVLYLPILLNAHLLSLSALEPRASSVVERLLLALALVLAMDLVLDPGAVALGFWGWDDPGAYYGVPAANYAGWMASGAVGVAAVELAFDRHRLRDRLETCPFLLDNFVAFVLFWGLVNASFRNWIPFALAALALFAFVRRFGLPRSAD